MSDRQRQPEPDIEPWVTDGPIEVDTGSPQDDGDPEAEIAREGEGGRPERAADDRAEGPAAETS
jgi:hypothetical protein